MGKKRNDELIAKVRTIFSSGKSLVITLPKGFVEKHGLRAGDRVPVIADSILKVVPMKEIS
jgi:hypothetical protein